MRSILRDAESRLPESGEKSHGRHAQNIFNVEHLDNLTLPVKGSSGSLKVMFLMFNSSGFNGLN